MVTEKMIEAAQKAVNTRHGLTDIEMRKALEAALSTDAEPVGWFNPWNEYHGYQQVDDGCAGEPGTIPLYAAPTAPCVAVNALEFEVDKTIRHANKDGVTTFSAKTPFCVYLIRQYPDGKFTLAFGFSGELWEHHSTFEDAKAAAKAHYKTCIRAALSAQVQDVAGPTDRYEKVFDGWKEDWK